MNEFACSFFFVSFSLVGCCEQLHIARVGEIGWRMADCEIWKSSRFSRGCSGESESSSAFLCTPRERKPTSRTQASLSFPTGNLFPFERVNGFERQVFEAVQVLDQCSHRRTTKQMILTNLHMKISTRRR